MKNSVWLICIFLVGCGEPRKYTINDIPDGFNCSTFDRDGYVDSVGVAITDDHGGVDCYLDAMRPIEDVVKDRQ